MHNVQEKYFEQDKIINFKYKIRIKLINMQNTE